MASSFTTQNTCRRGFLSLSPSKMSVYTGSVTRVAGTSSRPLTTAARATKKIDAVDRYSVIRNFFRQQHTLKTPGGEGGRPGDGVVAVARRSQGQRGSGMWRWKTLDPSSTIAFGGLGGRFGVGSCRTMQCSCGRRHDATGSGSGSGGSSSQGPEQKEKNDGGEKSSPQPPPPPLPPPHNLENYSRFFRRLALSLPHPHRPTRDDFLNVATGFWDRLRVRFKWFTIKSFRKFNADDISAFVTWFVMSQTLWIFVGTTTFFSVIFAVTNSLSLQHYIARAISDYLTSETGVTIIFESAIVPKWKDSRISFKNVYVSRRPSSDPSPRHLSRHEHIGVGYDVSNHPAYHRIGEEEDDSDGTALGLQEEDTNYTMFDLTIDSVDVTLSLSRWFDGKGLVEDAVVKGVRGVVDRRNVFWDPDNPLDPALFRHQYQTGDFELEKLQLEDVLVTVHQPGEFRPYTASIFRADIRTFRKRWLFYDFLRAENVVGQFDNCLFSLHRPQSIGRTTEKDLEEGDWGIMTRIRIDGVNIDHIQNSTTTDGPMSWITSGKVDAVLDIKFPRDGSEGLQLNAILEEIADAITTSIHNNTSSSSSSEASAGRRIPANRELAKPALSSPSLESYLSGGKDEKQKVVVDIDLRFRDLKAAVPIFTEQLSYVNNALIRPIVAFMNANRTLVPIHCRIVKDLSDFDGSWTMWETGLMDEVSVEVYEALAHHVSQAAMNRKRMKTVSWWSLQITANAFLGALKNVVDPVSAQLKEAYAERARGRTFADMMGYDTLDRSL